MIARQIDNLDMMRRDIIISFTNPNNDVKYYVGWRNKDYDG